MSKNLYPLHTHKTRIVNITALRFVTIPIREVISFRDWIDVLFNNAQIEDTDNGAIIQNANITCLVPVLDPAIVNNGKITAHIPIKAILTFPFFVYK